MIEKKMFSYIISTDFIYITHKLSFFLFNLIFANLDSILLSSVSIVFFILGNFSLFSSTIDSGNPCLIELA